MADLDRPPSRIVFAAIGGPLAVLLIAVTAIAITGTLARQTESTLLTFPAGITEVRIDVTQGAVTLRGADTESVTGERVVTSGIQTPDIVERVDGTTLVIEAGCNPIGNTWCNVSYVLEVPRAVTVRAQTGLGGIRANGVTGPADLQSGTGAVSVDDMAGTLRLESGAGSIEATGLSSATVRAFSGAGSVDLDFVSPPTFVDAGAGAGSVEIVVPKDATTYRIEETPGEDQNVRIAVTTDPTSGNVLKLESGAGGVSVHYPEA